MPLRASPEKKEEKERTRSALLRAALQLGSAHGFSSVGLREVARTAGIAPTSFYRHFADMEELGLALAEDLVGALLRGVVAERTAGPVSDALLDVMNAVLDGAAADPELTRFMLAELAGCSPRLRAALRARVSELAGTLHDLLQRAEQQDSIPHEVAQAAVTLLLDGCLRELETPQSDHLRLRVALCLSLRRLLTASDSRSAT
jgi:TetR/AcrR family transcriptional regulator, fatty acid biosynthesis regulator